MKLTRFKELKSVDKFIILNILILAVLLILAIVLEINHIIQYEDRKDEGNARWLQVEQRITEYEAKIDEFIK